MQRLRLIAAAEEYLENLPGRQKTLDTPSDSSYVVINERLGRQTFACNYNGKHAVLRAGLPHILQNASVEVHLLAYYQVEPSTAYLTHMVTLHQSNRFYSKPPYNCHTM